MWCRIDGGLSRHNRRGRIADLAGVRDPISARLAEAAPTRIKRRGRPDARSCWLGLCSTSPHRHPWPPPAAAGFDARSLVRRGPPSAEARPLHGVAASLFFRLSSGERRARDAVLTTIRHGADAIATRTALPPCVGLSGVQAASLRRRRSPSTGAVIVEHGGSQRRRRRPHQLSGALMTAGHSRIRLSHRSSRASAPVQSCFLHWH